MKVEELDAFSIPFFSRVWMAAMISDIRRPNLASSPPEVAHLPVPLDDSLTRIPSFGLMPVFLEMAMIFSSSKSFSMTMVML